MAQPNVPHPPSTPATRSHNVPDALSSFVGRATECRTLRELLTQSRLVTVTGAGGAGKTRLVREVVAAIADDDGAGDWETICWVELAPVRDGQDVPSALARALDVTPSPGRAMMDALLDTLRAQRALLVLDNCEHVIDAAASLAHALLGQAPRVSIIATSRELLAIDGEMAWPVPTLDRPLSPSLREAMDAAHASAFDSVRLFVDRTRAVQPAFALTDANAFAVASICSRLDGLPLAIELAAAVVPVFGIEGLNARLDSALSLLSRGRRTAVPRHQTLRAMLDWSHDLLDDDARRLLRHLAVFRSAFTLEAISAICDLPESMILPALGRLVEHSLVEVREEEGQARYRLLETVRQYGIEQLRASPEEHGVRDRHARWITRVAQSAEDALFSAARGRTVHRLRSQIDEIRAAIAWCTTDGDPMVAVELCAALAWFFISGVPWEEARALPLLALTTADRQGIADENRPLAEQLALGRLSYAILGLAYFGGDTEMMLEVGARELALWDAVARQTLTASQRLAMHRGRALCHQLTGLAHAIRGDAGTALRHMHASVETAEASGDAWLHAVMLMRRALAHQVLGDRVAAAADYHASLPPLRRMQEWWFLSLALEGLAMNHLLEGELPQAASRARESVLVLQPEPDQWFISRSLDTLAAVLLADMPDDRRGPLTARAREAVQFAGAADALRCRCGAGVIGPDVARHAEMHATLRALLGDAGYVAGIAAGAAWSLDDVFAVLGRDQLLPASATPASGTPAVRAPAVCIAVLGGFSVEVTGEPVDAIPVGKARELLLFLLLHAQATKDEIGLALWPDASAAQVRNAFHVTLHHLRRGLGEASWIVFERQAYRVVREVGPDTRMLVDLDQLSSTAAQAQQAWRRRVLVELPELQRWCATLQQHQGELASGVASGDWLVAHQDRVRALWSEGMLAIAELARQGGAWPLVREASATLIARDPLREQGHRLHMEALAATGEVALALAHFDQLTVLLRDEVGARPAAETRTLVERIRGQS